MNLRDITSLLALAAALAPACSDPDSTSNDVAELSSHSNALELERLWLVQFGTGHDELGGYVAVNASDRVIVAGTTFGDLGGTQLGGGDAFVREYSEAEFPIWTQRFGTTLAETAVGLAVDADDSILTLVMSAGSLEPFAPSLRGGFIRKYAANHDLLWTKQVALGNSDSLQVIATDSVNDIIVGGSGAFPGQDPAFTKQAYVRKLSGDGFGLWYREFGFDVFTYAQAVAIDPDDNVIVAGHTSPGSSVLDDAFVRKYTSNGGLLWTAELASPSTDHIAAVATDPAGNVFAGGYAAGTLPGAPFNSATFIRKYDPDGIVLWSRYADDLTLLALATDASGNLFMGGYTLDGLPNQKRMGRNDAVVRKYAPDGSTLWTWQFGSIDSDEARSLATDSLGNVFVGGTARSAIPDRGLVGGSDIFVRRFGPKGEPMVERGQPCSPSEPCRPGLSCVEDNGALYGFAPDTDVCACEAFDINHPVPAFCTDQCPCSVGQGGCKANDGCESGLDCAVVPGYGLPYGYGICVTCPTFDPSNPDTSFCSTQCKCDNGEGDCDGDQECAGDLFCGTDNGASYGLPETYDVCTNGCTQFDPSHPRAEFCSVDCPCTAGQGDCDADSECAPGLRCQADTGPVHGLPNGFDVCFGCPVFDADAPNANQCSVECPCAEGEGDCDSDADCAAGLRCGNDNGPSVGLPAGFDVCAPGCPNFSSTQPGADFCTKSCRCDDGQGDCDSDAECKAGLRCARDEGVLYGLPPSYDVCVSICPPFDPVAADADFCTLMCPCGIGEGDCDTDSQCAAGTYCGTNNGASYGLPADFDVCDVSCPALDQNHPNANFCTSDCPCDHGEGDCDSDAECSPGLRCMDNLGLRFGMPRDFDVCYLCPPLDLANPNPDQCNDPLCPCSEGEGDCDADAQCQGSLRCGIANGPSVGLPEDFDVCTPGCLEFTTAHLRADFCTVDCPCDEGQGDCDANSQCQDGLRCGIANGPSVGLPEDFDVCTQNCPEFTTTHPREDLCTADCPCDEGQGDCDAHAQCKPGLHCERDIGPDFGLPVGYDVCTSTCPAYESHSLRLDFCTPFCPCPEGQGDCDSDAECQPGLRCGINNGNNYQSSWFMPAEWDACAPGCPGFSVGDPRTDFCTVDCPCKEGQGNCDSDATCEPGLHCGTDNGNAYGLPAMFDVCH